MKHHLKSFMLLIAALMMIGTSLPACGNSSSSTNPQNRGLDPQSTSDFWIKSGELENTLTYGVYQEVELSLQGNYQLPIDWQVVDQDVPAGLYLEDAHWDQIVIFGTPLFVDQWCFTVKAVANNQKVAVKEICLLAQENEAIKHMTFHTGRQLPTAQTSVSYDEKIVANSDGVDAYEGELYSGTLPEGLELNSIEERSFFRLSGRGRTPGVYQFSLKVTDSFRNREAYKQFQLVVSDNDESMDCPAGYYYDDNVGYCVPIGEARCPDNTYYEPSTNSCVQYPLPPPTVYCGPDHYYDHYLNQCVRIGYPRCPLNYRYDHLYDRCVRQAYTCPIGTRYSYLTRQCEYVWPRTCSIGSHWDAYARRCVRNRPASCRAGSYWDRNSRICRPHRRTCNNDGFWHPRERRCVRRGVRCSPGSRYDYSRNRCVRIPHRARCGRGSHWSERTRRCESNRRPPRTEPRPPRRERPTPRPPRHEPNPPRRERPTPRPPRHEPNPPRRERPTPRPPRHEPNPPRRERPTPRPPRHEPNPPRRERPTPRPPRHEPNPPRRERPPRTQPNPPRRERPRPPRREQPRPPRGGGGRG